MKASEQQRGYLPRLPESVVDPKATRRLRVMPAPTEPMPPDEPVPSPEPVPHPTPPDEPQRRWSEVDHAA